MTTQQVDAQKVIESLLRQIADLAGKVAMLEALLAQTSENTGPEQNQG
jgi:hypothetical protein